MLLKNSRKDDGTMGQPEVVSHWPPLAPGSGTTFKGRRYTAYACNQMRRAGRTG